MKMQSLSVIRTAMLLQAQVRTYYPRLEKVKLHVSVECDSTASARLQGQEVRIILPEMFREKPVVGKLALGLATHELGHAFCTDLPGFFQHCEDASAEPLGHHYVQVANMLEDMRMESMFASDGPFLDFLCAPRQLCHDNADQEWGKTRGLRLDMYDVLERMRFQDATLPYSCPPLPRSWSFLTDQVLAYVVRDGVVAASDLFCVAKEIVDHYRGNLPSAPPESMFRLLVIEVPGGDGDELKLVLVVQRGNEIGAAEEKALGFSSMGPCPKDVPSQAILREGKKLGQRMSNGWTKRPIAKQVVGVGRYSARHDHPGAVLPPFVLKMPQRKQLPGKLVICLDVSGSMDTLQGGRTRLEQARVAAVAVDEAVRRADGRTALYVFSDRAIRVNTAAEMVTYESGGTSTKFMSGLVLDHPGWQYLFITDADISGVPSVWGARERSRSSVVFIGDEEMHVKELGDRVFKVTDISNLPGVVALAVRKFMGKNRI